MYYFKKEGQVHKSILCVDLDGTLINGDILFESALSLFSKNPFYIFLMIFWLLKGKAVLKQEIARRVDIDAARLPYRSEIIEYLKDKKNTFTLVLVTASDQKYADQVAKHLGFFDDAIGSNGRINLIGNKKAELLVNLYGEKQFIYMGDSVADIPVFSVSKHYIVVDNNKKIIENIKDGTRPIISFENKKPKLNDWLAAIRVHQWTKNILVFVPLIAAHLFFDIKSIFDCIDAFLSISLLASSAYVLNDMLDIEADRKHPKKSKRPFASGALNIKQGCYVFPALAIIGVLIGVPLGYHFVVSDLIYYATTISYSLYIKKISIIDVIVLACLYTLRIIAGTAAINVPLSFWLLAFSMFIFFSLAMLKRYTELLALEKAGKTSAERRGYNVSDIAIIRDMGCASGYISVMVLALYINSPASRILYAHPHALWLLCPVLLYWISRIWFMGHNGQVHHDPVVFAIKDRSSQIVAVLFLLIAIGATL